MNPKFRTGRKNKNVILTYDGATSVCICQVQKGYENLTDKILQFLNEISCTGHAKENEMEESKGAESLLPSVELFVEEFYKTNTSDNMNLMAINCIKAYAELTRDKTLEEVILKGKVKTTTEGFKVYSEIDKDSILSLKTSDKLKVH